MGRESDKYRRVLEPNEMVKYCLYKGTDIRCYKQTGSGKYRVRFTQEKDRHWFEKMRGDGIKREEKIEIFNINKTENHTILAIPDLHAPFIKDGYLEFVLGIRDKYKPTHVIFLGDVLDNHFSSYHETDPDGYGAGEELDRATDAIQLWYKEFPNAKTLLGNHGSLIQRKFITAGLSNKWMKSYKEVLKTPTWDFVEDFELDDVLYCHGEGRTAKNLCRDEMQSVVQGHRHSESYLEYYASPGKLCFAMQLGCGVDRKAYSMAYAKHFKKPQINCGIVLENGRYAIIEPMNMGI